MQKCPNCSSENRIGLVFCENCGASLIGDSPLGTLRLVSKIPETTTGSLVKQGTDQLFNGMVLRLEIEGAEPILLRPKRETVLGRRDPATGGMPDVDLTPFAGYRMGVSRKHAALRQSDNNRLELWDLGSGNGTYLNGVKLIPHRPNRVHDGDEIRLGQMVMRLYFQGPSSQSSNIDAKTDEGANPPHH